MRIMKNVENLMKWSTNAHEIASGLGHEKFLALYETIVEAARRDAATVSESVEMNILYFIGGDCILRDSETVENLDGVWIWTSAKTWVLKRTLQVRYLIETE